MKLPFLSVRCEPPPTKLCSILLIHEHTETQTPVHKNIVYQLKPFFAKSETQIVFSYPLPPQYHLVADLYMSTLIIKLMDVLIIYLISTFTHCFVFKT